MGCTAPARGDSRSSTRLAAILDPSALGTSRSSRTRCLHRAPSRCSASPGWQAVVAVGRDRSAARAASFVSVFDDHPGDSPGWLSFNRAKYWKYPLISLVGESTRWATRETAAEREGWSTLSDTGGGWATRSIAPLVG